MLKKIALLIFLILSFLLVFAEEFDIDVDALETSMIELDTFTDLSLTQLQTTAHTMRDLAYTEMAGVPAYVKLNQQNENIVAGLKAVSEKTKLMTSKIAVIEARRKEAAALLAKFKEVKADRIAKGIYSQGEAAAIEANLARKASRMAAARERLSASLAKIPERVRSIRVVSTGVAQRTSAYFKALPGQIQAGYVQLTGKEVALLEKQIARMETTLAQNEALARAGGPGQPSVYRSANKEIRKALDGRRAVVRNEAGEVVSGYRRALKEAKAKTIKGRLASAKEGLAEGLARATGKNVVTSPVIRALEGQLKTAESALAAAKVPGSSAGAVLSRKKIAAMESRVSRLRAGVNDMKAGKLVANNVDDALVAINGAQYSKLARTGRNLKSFARSAGRILGAVLIINELLQLGIAEAVKAVNALPVDGPYFKEFNSGIAIQEDEFVIGFADSDITSGLVEYGDKLKNGMVFKINVEENIYRDSKAINMYRATSNEGGVAGKISKFAMDLSIVGQAEAELAAINIDDLVETVKVFYSSEDGQTNGSFDCTALGNLAYICDFQNFSGNTLPTGNYDAYMVTTLHPGIFNTALDEIQDDLERNECSFRGIGASTNDSFTSVNCGKFETFFDSAKAVEEIDAFEAEIDKEFNWKAAVKEAYDKTVDESSEAWGDVVEAKGLWKVSFFARALLLDLGRAISLPFNAASATIAVNKANARFTAHFEEIKNTPLLANALVYGYPLGFKFKVTEDISRPEAKVEDVPSETETDDLTIKFTFIDPSNTLAKKFTEFSGSTVTTDMIKSNSKLYNGGDLVSAAVVSEVTNNSIKLVAPKGIIAGDKTFVLDVDIKNSEGKIKKYNITGIGKVSSGN
jgi:hypothetical protein